MRYRKQFTYQVHAVTMIKNRKGRVMYSDNLRTPDVRADGPLQNLYDDDIQQALNEFGQHVGADPIMFPYLYDRYPDDLYGDDPGIRMPMPTISANPRNATMVVGIR